ncbi:MAG: hypothetical protein MUF73_04535 [Rhodobacteraceae bacterium]|jgi:hypothetical protein|nr:hypothetical protein [Paracoccaceae bacterium]
MAIALAQAQDLPNDAPVPDSRAAPMAVARAALDVFADVTDCLSTLRGMQVRLQDDLGAYGRLVASCLEATSHFDALADRTAATQRALDALQDPTAVDRAAQEGRQTHHYLIAIGRTGRALSAIATLSRTTAASFGITTLAAYLDSLSAIAAKMQDDSQTVTGLLQVVMTCRSQSEASAAALHRSLDAIITGVSEAQDRLHMLAAQEHEAAATVARETDALRDASHNQIKGFVTAIQFADRLAQRLDHLSAMLSYDDPHIRRLASAHLASIAAAMRDTGQHTTGCITAIAAISADGSRLLLSGHVAETIQTSIHTRRDAAERSAVGMAALDADMRLTRALIERTMDAHRKVEAHVDQLATASKEVGTTAINSVLLVPRGGAAQGALATLSAEVRRTATQCLAAVGGCKAGMNALVDLSIGRQAEVVAEADRLSAAVANLQAEVLASRDRMSDLRSLCASAAERVDTMLTVVARVRDGMTRISQLADQVETMAGSLDAPPAADCTPDAALLAAIWDSYTMDEERRVHADVFADLGMTIPTPAAASASDDDDGFTF